MTVPDARLVTKAALSRAAAGGVRLDAMVALQNSSPPSVLSISLNGGSRQVVAAYSASYAVRRTVFNPLAPAHVVGIWQHVDVALEARRALAATALSAAAAQGQGQGPGPGQGGAALGAAAALQLNRVARVAARIEAAQTGARGAASLTLRTWSDPAAAVTATLHYDVLCGWGVGVALDVSHSARVGVGAGAGAGTGAGRGITTSTSTPSSYGGRDMRNHTPHKPSLSFPASPPLKIAGAKESAARADM